MYIINGCSTDYSLPLPAVYPTPLANLTTQVNRTTGSLSLPFILTNGRRISLANGIVHQLAQSSNSTTVSEHLLHDMCVEVVKRYFNYCSHKLDISKQKDCQNGPDCWQTKYLPDESNEACCSLECCEKQVLFFFNGWVNALACDVGDPVSTPDSRRNIRIAEGQLAWHREKCKPLQNSRPDGRELESDASMKQALEAQMAEKGFSKEGIDRFTGF